MKKLIVLVCLATLMCFGFVGCKEEGSTTAPSETTAVAPAEEAAAPAVEEAVPAVEEAATAVEEAVPAAPAEEAAPATN
ncbi:MAG: hypothetical protein U9N19_00270 [Thermodesulfobacteriota bacterium]|nr:hypothetical protein [Thermodesulfobacteriota bacterium]